ncbi:7tm 6 domain containing protein [Asbolus verrucosus]|uniref:Odorant receptor n=1 Tax=Asbolus verrucosus TaxID=1661398 RepID=A0A482VHW8_ASBVE|nr:7tm 6 domain containing protein [Asbolus verrucosus]
MEKFDWKCIIRSTIIRLQILGLWPGGDEAYKLNLYTLWSTFSVSLFIVGQPVLKTINIIFIFGDLEAVIANVYLNLSEVLNVLKAYFTIKNMKILKQLMMTLNSDLFQPRNHKQINLVQSGLKLWKINSSFFWMLAMGTVFFMATSPFFNNSVKEHELPFSAWYPYDIKISPYYEITYVYQVISITFSASTAVCTDTLIAALFVYIGAQFDILCADIRHLYDIAEDESTDFSKKFINCIKHHRAILKFAENSSKFANWIILGQFFISALSIGMTMFRLTTVVPLSGEFFSFIAFLMGIVVETFTFCWFGNEVEIKSSQIPYAVFESSWTNASTEVKKHMIFFITKCQKPLKMSALNLFYLSLDTFTKILRASWSYFAVLYQISTRA